MRARFSVAWFAALGALAAGPLVARPGAFELLAQVRKAYQELGTYRDRGEIELVERFGPPRRLRFETTVDGEDAFRLVVQSAEDPETEHRVLWRDGDDVFLLDVALGQYRRIESLAAGIAAILDEDVSEALVVAGWLAGSSEILANPESAEVEGEKPCGRSSTCYLLSLSRMSGIIESQLWIDPESSLVRRLEVEFRPPGEALARLLSEEGQPQSDAPRSSAASTTISVKHEIGAVDQPALSPDWVDGLPEGARLVEQWEIPMELGAADWDREARVHFVADEISPDLFALGVRAVDGGGRPLLGLGPEDFRVGGASGEVTVTAADWVSFNPEERDELLLARLAEAGVRIEPPEKLVVFFVKSSLDPQLVRGHLRTLPHVQELVELLQPDDRAAVVSLDSHLKLWQDFTRRRDAVADALEKAIGFGGSPPSERGGEPSLAEHLDSRAAQEAGTPEQALRVIAGALTPLDGEKILIYLGWGVRQADDKLRKESDYELAVRVLGAARAAVFVLDVAGDSQQAARRLARAISGYYVLMLDGGRLEDHSLRVELREQEGGVYPMQF
ncbi:MAG: hypothetical protein GY856_20695 [bacterium]|nr:hypothetical protein [bacterium]